jgi:F-box protein 18 (helicase)
MSLPLTEEQKAVVRCEAPIIVINAFAGTGKTTTLKAYAEARPGKRILFMAFNRSVAEEAKKIMPPHVVVKTSHALAWAQTARLWRKEKLESRFSAWTLVKQNLPYLGGLRDIPLADLVVRTINNFCHSSYTDLDRYLRTRFVKEDGLERLKRFSIDLDQFSELVCKVWARMVNAEDPFPATHDTYFKLWQISRPQLDFDIILLDEGQDTNPALYDVFIRQTHARRVLVGDRHQNIYSFRGAMNAMEAMQKAFRTAEHLALTRSFRFGDEVARVANAILREFKGETLRICGNPQKSSVVSGAIAQVETVLFRTNAELFDAAAKTCLHIRNAQINFLGGFENYAFNDILDTYYLYSGDRHNIRNAFLRGFDSFLELKFYAKAVDDKELIVRCNVVEEYQDDIPLVYNLIKAAANPNAPLTMTTAHKAKGCEWENVILGDDFHPLCYNGLPDTPKYHPNLGQEHKFIDTQEVNLWYVAITRSKTSLCTNWQLNEFLNFLDKENKVPQVGSGNRQCIGSIQPNPVGIG